MSNQEAQQIIRENWLRVLDDVTQATENAGRSLADITIVGVTKYVDAATTAALVDAGCQHLGENRPQLLWEKAESGLISDSVQWHVIGHLQRNKVRRTLRHRPLIHSVDSQRLLIAIAEESKKSEITTRLMLEVNISGEEAKTGMNRDSLEEILQQAPPEGVHITGLMAMAGLGSDPAEAEKQFAAVRTLRDQLQESSGKSLPDLSMGMSGDFREAISQGATHVRIGTRLFKGILD